MKARYIGSGHPDLTNGMQGQAHLCEGYNDPESHEFRTLIFEPDGRDYAVYLGPDALGES